MPRFLLLLSPSVSSGALTMVGALGILIVSGWLYISNNQLFYDELFGIYGFKTLLIQNDVWYAFQHMLFDSTATYYVMLLMAGITVGLIIFTLLEGIRRTATAAAEEVRQVEDHNPSHKAAAREALERLLLRIASLVGWSVYVALFINIILPFCIILNQAGIDAFDSSKVSGAWYCFEAFALLIVSVHMHIIFARLCVLRPRLFGDSDIEMAKYRKY